MPDDMLANIPLFAALPAAERAELNALLRPKNVPANQTVVWLGEKGDDFFIVHKGRLGVVTSDESGKEVKLATLGVGQFFGEISLLDGGPRTATVRAEEDSSLLALGREDFLKFLLHHPDAAIHMLTVLGQRQRDTLEKVRGIRNANEAIAEHASNWHKLAQKIAAVSASRAFVIFNVLLFALWILVNVLLGRFMWAGLHPFDEAPTFGVLGFIVTIEALFISLFVLISQGLQGERDRIRADLDYQVNVKAHQEVMQLQQKVDRLAQLLTTAASAKNQNSETKTADAGPNPNSETRMANQTRMTND
jgi:CRP-like cAMP-binding protein